MGMLAIGTLISICVRSVRIFAWFWPYIWKPNSKWFNTIVDTMCKIIPELIAGVLNRLPRFVTADANSSHKRTRKKVCESDDAVEDEDEPLTRRDYKTTNGNPLASSSSSTLRRTRQRSINTAASATSSNSGSRKQRIKQRRLNPSHLLMFVVALYWLVTYSASFIDIMAHTTRELKYAEMIYDKCVNVKGDACLEEQTRRDQAERASRISSVGWEAFVEPGLIRNTLYILWSYLAPLTFYEYLIIIALLQAVVAIVYIFRALFSVSVISHIKLDPTIFFTSEQESDSVPNSPLSTTTTSYAQDTSTSRDRQYVPARPLTPSSVFSTNASATSTNDSYRTPHYSPLNTRDPFNSPEYRQPNVYSYN